MIFDQLKLMCLFEKSLCSENRHQVNQFFNHFHLDYLYDLFYQHVRLYLEMDYLLLQIKDIIV